jgi:hypothetical protein
MHVGTGALYGGDGLGIAVEYQRPWGPNFRLSPFAATGIVGLSDEAPAQDIGYSIGINAEYGTFQRVFAGPSYGTQFMDVESDTAHAGQTLSGFALVLGYKGTSSFGFLWLAYLGMGYVITTGYHGLAPTFGIGLGYKF